MFATFRSIILGAALALAALVPAMAAGFDAAQRSEIEKIIREYLIANPQVLQDVMMELDKRQAAMDSQRQQAAVRENARDLFSSSRHVVVGNEGMEVREVSAFESAASLVSLPAADIAELLTHEYPDLIRECAGDPCTLWFLDRTRSHRRRFCSAAVCGNRAKVAAFRERQRE